MVRSRRAATDSNGPGCEGHEVTRRTRVALLVGAASGLLSGLFGVGGGTVIVPGLVLLLGVAQHAAHATSLAAIVLIAPAALLGFLLDGSVAFGAAVAISAGAAVGAVAGAALMQRMTAARLRQAFAVLLLLVAVRLLVPSAQEGGGMDQGLDVLRVLGLVGLGLAAGALSAALGVGGGVVVVPALVLWFDFSPHVAEGTSLLVILPTAVAGVLRHQRQGLIDWRLGLLLGAGGVVTGLIGAQGALALPSALLQQLFAVFVALVAVRMLVPPRPRPGRGDRGDRDPRVR